MPHKEAALGAGRSVDPLARRIGAVNTVVVAADGRLEGSNTDAFGFLENLRAGAPGWSAGDGPGGGARRRRRGARRGRGAASMPASPEIRLVNRTPARAAALAARSRRPIARASPGRARASARGRGAAGQHAPASAWPGSRRSTSRSTRCRGRRWSTTSSMCRWRRRCWRRRARAAIARSTGSACCCIRRGRASPPGSASSPR